MTAPNPATLEREQDRLFVTDAELLRRLGIDPAKGRMILRALDDQHERTGFPQKSKLWGKRYWPALKAWLDRTNGLNIEPPSRRAQAS